MALTKDQKNRIEEIAKSILLSRIDSFPDQSSLIRNAPFHEAFLEGFKHKLKPLKIDIPYLIALSSWLHGLNTSLGSGFENIAHVLSGGYKRNFTKSYILNIKSPQASKIEEIVRDLKSGKRKPDLDNENKLIFQFKDGDKSINALPFTVDNYIEDNKKINAIELKSVRPNSGEARGEKQKILYAKAAFKILHPKKKINFYIGFPFDPTSKNPFEYNKERFFNYLVEFKKFFAYDEILIGNELWNYLSSSKNTMEEIIEVIKNTVKIIKKWSNTKKVWFN